MSALALKTTAVVGGVTFLGWVIMKTTSPSKEEMMKVKNLLIFAFIQEKRSNRLFLNYFIEYPGSYKGQADPHIFLVLALVNFFSACKWHIISSS